MQSGNQCVIDLKQRFSAGKYHIFMMLMGYGPERINGMGEGFSVFEFTPTFTICSHKIGVAECADRVCSVLFPSGPEVASSKSAEYRGSTRLVTFPLKGVKHFFDTVSHLVYSPDSTGWRVL